MKVYTVWHVWQNAKTLIDSKKSDICIKVYPVSHGESTSTLQKETFAWSVKCIGPSR